MMHFGHVQTFEELQRVNLAFVEGKLEQSPYHYGGLDEESASILDFLVQLNQNGFVTVDSQPGVLTNELEQRAYVAGYLPIERLSTWFNYFQKHLQEDYHCVVYTLHSNGRSVKPHLLYNTLPFHFYNVTRYRKSNGRTQEWSYPTNIQPRVVDYDFLGFANIKKLLVKRAVKIILISIQYGAQLIWPPC